MPAFLATHFAKHVQAQHLINAIRALDLTARFLESLQVLAAAILDTGLIRTY